MLSRGEVFGETAILAPEPRTTTVQARGAAVAYGMTCEELHKVLWRQYTEVRKDVIAALNDVMEGGRKCSLLRGITPHQSQCLYDRAIAQTYEPGKKLNDSMVHIVCRGSVAACSADGVELKHFEQYEVVGSAHIFDEESSEYFVAQERVQTLALTRGLLQDMFGDELHEVLLLCRLQVTLSRVKNFADKLDSEAIDKLARSANILEVPVDGSVESSAICLAICLCGEVDAAPFDGDQAILPQACSLSHLRNNTLATDVENMLMEPWSARFWWKPCGGHKSVARIAVYQPQDLQGNLKLRSLSNTDAGINSQASDYASRVKVVLSSAASSTDEVKDPTIQHKAEALRNVVVLQSLSMTHLERLAALLEPICLSVGEVVFKQGDKGDDFFIVVHGLLEVKIFNRVVRTIGVGDYIGERAPITKQPRSATVTVLEECELWRMSGSSFISVINGPILEHMESRIALQNTNISVDNLEVVRKVGEGGFGVVKMVRAKDTGTRYALKCVNIRHAVERKQQKSLMAERSIMAEVDHPFIIKFIRSFRGANHICFLMELVTGGELLDYLDNLGRTLMRSEAQFYVGAIVLALEFLHNRQIAYLDLKGENCLLDHHGYLKIIDFGVAERVKSGRLHAVKGTPLFMAPEVIKPTRGYTTTADLWSLGVCIYDFMVGQFPFGDAHASQVDILKAVLKAPLRFPAGQKIPTLAKKIIRALLMREPDGRLGAGPGGYKALKGHEFFQGNDFSFDCLLSRQLTAPFVPKKEMYHDDVEKENGDGVETPVSATISTAADARDDGWEDPDPEWQEAF